MRECRFSTKNALLARGNRKNTKGGRRMTTLIDLLEEELLELQKENPLLTENVANEIVLLVKI